MVSDGTGVFWAATYGIQGSPVPGLVLRYYDWSAAQIDQQCLAVDDSTLYWASRGGSIHSSPKSGGAIAINVTNTVNITAMAVDATSLYWAGFTSDRDSRNLIYRQTPK